MVKDGFGRTVVEGIPCPTLWYAPICAYQDVGKPSKKPTPGQAALGFEPGTFRTQSECATTSATTLAF
jgi:hypothetical protein